MLQELLSLWDAIKTAHEIYKLTHEQAEFLKDPGHRQEFNNIVGDVKPTIINVNGNFYLGNYTNAPKEFKDALFKNFNDNNSSKKIDVKVIDNKFYERIQKNNSITDSDQLLSRYYNNLDIQNKNILQQSFKVKKLYEIDPVEAQRIKDDIGYQYGKDGRKLCNLYTQNYINQLVEFLEMFHAEDISQVSKVINGEINNFLENSDYIFFIHVNSNENTVISKIFYGLNHSVEFIALHGAGLNVDKVVYIKDKIIDEIKRYHYVIDEKRFTNKKGKQIISIIITIQ